MFKGVSKKCDLSENNVNVASDPKTQNSFFNTIQLVSLDLIKLWSVTCPSTLESLQKMEFEVNNDINWKVSLCQGDITKLNVDAIEISANKALIVGGVIVGVIHEAARPGWWGEFQKLNGCETDECKVTLGYKLPAKYVFHAARSRDKNYDNLNNFYKSFLWKVLASNVNSVVFCCGAIDISRFDPRKAAQMALATARLWLGPNHLSMNHVVCTYENAD